ncbi:MAG TPA: hypothetical protein VF715_02555 [Thermoleophilaceae bacterium]
MSALVGVLAVFRFIDERGERRALDVPPPAPALPAGDDALIKRVRHELVATIDEWKALGDPSAFWTGGSPAHVRLQRDKTAEFIETVFGAMERQRFLEAEAHPDLTGVVEAHVKRLASLRDRPETWELQVDREGLESAHRRRVYLSPQDYIVLANRELEGTAATDPDAVADAYADWLRKKLNRLPDRPPTGISHHSLLYDSEARASSDAQDEVAIKQYEDKIAEVERDAREEYQNDHRDRVLAVLPDAHAERASEPHTIRDFEAIGRLLANQKAGAAERARAKKDGFTKAGERLRERLDAVESHEMLVALVEDIDRWRTAVSLWARSQRGRSGSYQLSMAFIELPDTRHFPQHSAYQNIVWYLNDKLSALDLYDPEDDQ